MHGIRAGDRPGYCGDFHCVAIIPDSHGGLFFPVDALDVFAVHRHQDLPDVDVGALLRLLHVHLGPFEADLIGLIIQVSDHSGTGTTKGIFKGVDIISYFLIWMAPDKAEAQRCLDDFINLYGAKYPKAAECLQKDREALLTFYDFPAEHWKHIRTTNPIESTFSTVRLRTDKVRSCFSSKTVVTMAFKLCQCAQKRWQRLHSHKQLAKIIKGVRFINGIEEIRNAA